MKNVNRVGLRQVGTSVVMTIPVKMLEELEWGEGDQVELEVSAWAGKLHLVVEKVWE